MANNFFFGKGLLVRFEEKTVASGKRVSAFNVLLSEPRKKDDTERRDDGTFINVEAWQLPENVVSFLNDNVKRTQVSFQGRLKQDRWEKDGVKKSAYKIIADADTIKPIPLKKKEEAPPPKEKVTTESEIPF